MCLTPEEVADPILRCDGREQGVPQQLDLSTHLILGHDEARCRPLAE